MVGFFEFYRSARPFPADELSSVSSKNCSKISSGTFATISPLFWSMRWKIVNGVYYIPIGVLALCTYLEVGKPFRIYALAQSSTGVYS